MAKAHAMRSLRVLLLNLGSSDEMRTTLADILLPYFGLKTIDFWPGDACSAPVTFDLRDLSQRILGCSPAIIFLVPAANLMEQTREVLKLMRKDFPAIPVMVLAEAGDPDEML